MFRIKIAAKARRELKNISKLHKDSIDLILKEIKDDPYIGKPLTRELTGRYSCKISVYRIVYTINKKDKKVYIITAGHRAKVYS